MISLDTETTGVDLHHGALPFFVTTCDEEGEQHFWEWEVDPLTRRPTIPSSDLDYLRGVIGGEDLVLQNAKFDIEALDALGDGLPFLRWDWDAIDDTLIAGHVLASNQPHNLTDMTLHYLAVDIHPYEEALHEAVVTGRRMVQQARLRVAKDKADRWDRNLAEWRIAGEGLAEMPSYKASSNPKRDPNWKFDSWLPRALRKVKMASDYPEWDDVLREYSNTDSAATIELWKVMREELRRQDLWEIYRQKVKVAKVIVGMEQRPISMSKARLQKLEGTLRVEAEQRGRAVVAFAKSRNFDLELPKGASPNQSLRDFCFKVLDLPRIYNPKAKTAEPTLNKDAMTQYRITLEGEQLQFISGLADKRKKDTALAYLAAYRRYWVPLPEHDDGLWMGLHPGMNQTGSDTLRFSSSDPNIQNVSKQKMEDDEGEDHRIRDCFGPAPGREWWALDYENLELRIPAYEAEEKELIDLFERADEPPYYGSEHLLNFSTVYPDIWEQELRAVGIDKVGPHIKKKYKDTWYQRCKNGDFAVGYGAVFKASGLGTADRTFGRPGSHARLRARFARKEALNQKYIKFADKFGYVETLPDRSLGCKRGYPLMCSRSEWGKISPTIPLNYHVQGSAMWCTIKAMIRCQEQLDKWNAIEGPLYFLAIQVHDEIVFDFPKRGAANLPKIRTLQRLMAESGDDIGIPLRVSVSYHPVSWGADEPYKKAA